MKIYTTKRHIKQMNNKEKEFLNNTIRNTIKTNCENEKLTYSLHSSNRFKEKFTIELTEDDLIDTLLTGNFIEYKKIYKNNILQDERVVLRKNMKKDSEYDLVLVYSLKDNKIITVWSNKNTDNHYSLNLDKYSRKPIC